MKQLPEGFEVRMVAGSWAGVEVIDSTRWEVLTARHRPNEAGKKAALRDLRRRLKDLSS